MGGIGVYYQLILAHIKGVIFSQAIKPSPDNPAIPRNPRATQNKQPKPTCKRPLIGRGTNAVALGRTVPSVSNQRGALNSWSQILFSNWLIVFLSTGIIYYMDGVSVLEISSTSHYYCHSQSCGSDCSEYLGDLAPCSIRG